jgi:hypothetical protein
MSVPGTWSRLPPEVLEIIFRYVPHFSLWSVGEVCVHWRSVLHVSAHRFLADNVRKQRLEESQLARFGWNPGKGEHDILACNCIRAAYGFFMQNTQSPERGREIGNIFQPTLFWLPPPYAAVHSGNKLFFVVRDGEGTRVQVIDRLTPESSPRILKTLGGPGQGRVSVRLCCFEDLLVILEEVEEEQENEQEQEQAQVEEQEQEREGSGNRALVKVCLWSAQGETLLQELDYLAIISSRCTVAVHVKVVDIAMSRNMLALKLHINYLERGTSPFVGWHYPDVKMTLFWRVDTTGHQPTPTLPKFLKMVWDPEGESFYQYAALIYVNDRYFVGNCRLARYNREIHYSEICFWNMADYPLDTDSCPAYPEQ